jgi:hypothetical protein
MTAFIHDIETKRFRCVCGTNSNPISFGSTRPLTIRACSHCAGGELGDNCAMGMLCLPRWTLFAHESVGKSEGSEVVSLGYLSRSVRVSTLK